MNVDQILAVVRKTLDRSREHWIRTGGPIRPDDAPVVAVEIAAELEAEASQQQEEERFPSDPPVWLVEVPFPAGPSHFIRITVDREAANRTASNHGDPRFLGLPGRVVQLTRRRPNPFAVRVGWVADRVNRRDGTRTPLLGSNNYRYPEIVASGQIESDRFFGDFDVYSYEVVPLYRTPVEQADRPAPTGS